MTGAGKTDTANSKENTAKEEMGMTLLICLYPVRDLSLNGVSLPVRKSSTF